MTGQQQKPQPLKNGSRYQLTKCPIPPALLETIMSTATARALQRISEATSPVPVPTAQGQSLLRDLEKLKNAAVTRRYKTENAKRKNQIEIAQARKAELYAVTVYSYMEELTRLLAGKESDWVNNSIETKAYYDSRKKGGALENPSKYLHTGLGTGFFVISAIDFVTPLAKILQTLWVTHPEIVTKATELMEKVATLYDVLIKSAVYAVFAGISLGISYLVKYLVEKHKRGLDGKEQRDVEVDKENAKKLGSALGKDATERSLVCCVQYGFLDQLDTIPEGKKYEEVAGAGMEAVWKVYGEKLRKVASELPEPIRYLLHTPSKMNGSPAK
jgi:hypothetical protein